MEPQEKRGMSHRRLRKDVEVYGFLDPDLEVVLKARNSLSDPDKWIQAIWGRISVSAWQVIC